MTKNNNIYFKTPSQTVGPFFGNYLNFNFSKKTYVNFKEKIENNINSQKFSIIAEIKKASPSSGIIINDYDPVKIANIVI